MVEMRLPESWNAALGDQLAAPYMHDLRGFLRDEIAAGKAIYPPPAQWFAALDATPLEAVRVVILGQDPYHGRGQAHGLCFSVPPGVRPPPSLVNIFKEIASDLGADGFGLHTPDHKLAHGNLQHWADQGVLLLNSVLTVAAGHPAAHKRRGWEQFTDAVIAAVAARPAPCVFMLWGSYAQQKAKPITTHENSTRHLLLHAPHPSPLSAYTGWFGSRHFSQANAFLIAHGQPPIDWRLRPEI